MVFEINHLNCAPKTANTLSIYKIIVTVKLENVILFTKKLDWFRFSEKILSGGFDKTNLVKAWLCPFK
ncbi:MAG: hypothetical protein KKI18_08240 [Planctomycetes bacterium]|nr:hypothetical protein [Planctomycetota bacterium]